MIEQGDRWTRRGVRAAALGYLGVLLVVPLALLVVDAFRDGPLAFGAALASPAARHAAFLTLWTAALTALVNAFMGTLTAYVLVRYDFTGKTLLESVLDLPLALPTLVSGVMLLAVVGRQGPVGAWLDRALGVRIAYTPVGIVLALLFVTLPFVVRLVEPALREMDREPEHAAATLGASPRTIFFSVTLPAIRPAVSAGALLSFARAIGEFGAIVIIAGNLPHKTQTAAIYVLGEIESENQRGASAMSVAMLATAFALTALVDRVQGEPRGRAR